MRQYRRSAGNADLGGVWRAGARAAAGPDGMVDANLRRTKSDRDPYGAGVPIAAWHRNGRRHKALYWVVRPTRTRGIVFAVMVFDAGVPGKETLVLTAACTVLLSIIVHGATANPLIAVLRRNRVSRG